MTYRYLAVPSDRQDPAGARVFTVADDKARALAASEMAAARAQEEAAREAASPCSKQPTDEKLYPGEPSARELCKAVEAAYLAPQRDIEGMKQSCNGIGPNDMGKAMMCLMGQLGSVGGGPLLYLNSFEKLECIPPEFSGETGWVCDYISGVRSENAMMRDMLRQFGDEVKTDRFVKSTRGWIMIRQ